jgi:hypothetical protein
MTTFRALGRSRRGAAAGSEQRFEILLDRLDLLLHLLAMRVVRLVGGGRLVEFHDRRGVRRVQRLALRLAQLVLFGEFHAILREAGLKGLPVLAIFQNLRVDVGVGGRGRGVARCLFICRACRKCSCILGISRYTPVVC